MWRTAESSAMKAFQFHEYEKLTPLRKSELVYKCYISLKWTVDCWLQAADYEPVTTVTLHPTSTGEC